MPAVETTASNNSSALAPFEVPIFRAIWFASMASNFGGIIQSVGASWMMTTLTHSPAVVGLVQASTTLPIMLLSLFAGAIADNLDRRRVMLIAQTFMLIVSAGLSFCAWSGWLSPWLLLTFTFLIGIGTAFNAPSWQASVGDMVPRTALPGAVAMNSMGFNIARSVGPAAGGAIVAVAGAAAAFLVNALSYVGLIAVLLRWRPVVKDRAMLPEPLGAAMGAGIRYVAMSPDIRNILLRGGLFGLAASAISAMMPLVALHIIGGGPFTYGMLLGAFGIGAVIGALGGSRLRKAMTTETMVRGATVALAAGAAVTGLSHSMLLTLFALVISGAGWVVALSTFNVTVQLASPRWVVGRAVALYQMVTFGGMALGSWAFGELATLHGVPTALVFASVLQLAGALVGVYLPIPQASDLDLNPLRRWKEPAIAVSIEPRSGPIVVTIEYRIAPENINSFLAAMNERRRIRIRDGARHWTLLRDLEVDDLWLERYHVPTWNDYVRHNHRPTQADAANANSIRALQQEGIPIVAHRMIERQTVTPAQSTMPELRDALTDPTRST